MIAIVAALSQEVSGLRRKAEGAGLAVGHDNDMVVYQIGVGRDRVLRSLSRTLGGSTRPDSILALGFTGAVDDRLSTGDLVIANRVLTTEEQGSIECDPELKEMATKVMADLAHLRGFSVDTLTVPYPVLSPGEKELLSKGTDAWAINMEDYWIGKAAQQEGIPFVSVRAVLDTAHQEIPAYVAGLADKGKFSQVSQITANVLVRPLSLPKLVTLSRQMRVARQSLAEFGISFATRATRERSHVSS